MGFPAEGSAGFEACLLLVSLLPLASFFLLPAPLDLLVIGSSAASFLVALPFALSVEDAGVLVNLLFEGALVVFVHVTLRLVEPPLG